MKLVYSSFSFIMTLFAAIYMKYYIFIFLFICLIFTSVMNHIKYKKFTEILDKAVVFIIVLYTVYFHYINYNHRKKLYVSIFLIIWLYLILIYFYGYYFKDYCFHSNIDIANNYHLTGHILCAIYWTILILFY